MWMRWPADTASPSAFAPLLQVRRFGAQRGVIAVARVDDGVVAVDAEQLTGDVPEQFLESPWLPSLSKTAREQALSRMGKTMIGG